MIVVTNEFHVETATHAAVTYWESMDAFEAWTESEAFREAHRKRARLILIAVSMFSTGSSYRSFHGLIRSCVICYR